MFETDKTSPHFVQFRPGLAISTLIASPEKAGNDTFQTSS
jgi:hypothetical protein